jgi:hypothetical protein
MNTPAEILHFHYLFIASFLRNSAKNTFTKKQIFSEATQSRFRKWKNKITFLHSITSDIKYSGKNVLNVNFYQIQRWRILFQSSPY